MFIDVDVIDQSSEVRISIWLVDRQVVWLSGF